MPVTVSAKGWVLTLWIPCRPGNRRRILDRVRQMPEAP